MFSNLNFLAILVSGAVYWVLGGIWYAAVFSKQYQAALNFSPEQAEKAKQDFPKALAVHLLSGVITAFVLAKFVGFMGAATLAAGIGCGLLAWLGFALTLKLNAFMFEKTPKGLVLINSGFYLIAFAVMGGILAVW